MSSPPSHADLVRWFLEFLHERGGSAKSNELGELYKRHPEILAVTRKGKLKSFCDQHPALIYESPPQPTEQAIIRSAIGRRSAQAAPTRDTAVPHPQPLRPAISSPDESSSPTISSQVQSPVVRSADRDQLAMALAGPGVNILTVGSGDASQQLSIAETHTKMVVTFYDSREQVERKYEEAENNLRLLEARGVTLKFNVDACKLGEYPEFAGVFDVVMFYFPHTGIPNNDPGSAESNKSLIRGFLGSVDKVLKADGEVHLAVKTQGPYKSWGVDDIIRASGLSITNKYDVDHSMFPTYKHRATLGCLGNAVHRRPVPDANAAVYTLEPAPCLESTHVLRALCRRGVRFRAHVWHTTTVVQDEQLLDPICEIVAAAPANCQFNPLEIRRILNHQMDFENPVDTRQLNRVLTSLVSTGNLTKHDPVAGSTKPTYSVTSVHQALSHREISRTPESQTVLCPGGYMSSCSVLQGLFRYGLSCSENTSVGDVDTVPFQAILDILHGRASDGGEPMGALELSRCAGLNGKSDANRLLYQLESCRAVEKVESDTGAVRWRAVTINGRT